MTDAACTRETLLARLLQDPDVRKGLHPDIFASLRRRWQAGAPKTQLVFTGEAGVGKSQLLSQILDTDGLCPSQGNGKSCTQCPWLLSHSADHKGFTARAIFYRAEEWQLKVEPLLHEAALPAGGAHDEVRQAAQETLTRIYGPGLFQAGVPSYSSLQSHPLHRRLGTTQSAARANKAGGRKKTAVARLVKALSSGEPPRKLGPRATGEAGAWPLVKRFEVEGDFPLLASGLVLVDLPGNNDSQALRDGAADDFVGVSDYVFVVCNLKRALDNQAARQKLAQVLRQSVDNGRASRFAYVLTYSDEGHEELNAADLGAECIGPPAAPAACAGGEACAVPGHAPLGVALRAARRRRRGSGNSSSGKAQQARKRRRLGGGTDESDEAGSGSVEETDSGTESSESEMELAEDGAWGSHAWGERCLGLARNQQVSRRLCEQARAEARRRGLAEAQIPAFRVFPTSSRDYKLLRERGAPEDGQKTAAKKKKKKKKRRQRRQHSPTWSTAEETNVPALQRYVARIGGEVRDAHVTRLLHELQLALWGSPRRAPGAAHPEADAAAAACLHAFETRVEVCLRENSQRLSRAFAQDLAAGTASGLRLAKAQIPQMLARFAADQVLYPSTLAAILRRGGHEYPGRHGAVRRADGGERSWAPLRALFAPLQAELQVPRTQYLSEGLGESAAGLRQVERELLEQLAQLLPQPRPGGLEEAPQLQQLRAHWAATRLQTLANVRQEPGGTCLQLRCWEDMRAPLAAQLRESCQRVLLVRGRGSFQERLRLWAQLAESTFPGALDECARALLRWFDSFLAALFRGYRDDVLLCGRAYVETPREVQAMTLEQRLALQGRLETLVAELESALSS